MNKTTKLIIIISVVTTALVIMLVYLNKEDYYKVESRVDNVKTEKQKDEKEYKTIGWIKVQGTNIDMPVVLFNKGEEDYPVEKEKYSWIMKSNGKFNSKIDIMGHNIFNLSSLPSKNDNDFLRFEGLMAFVYEDFAKENKYIQLTMDNKEYVYKIFAVNFVDSTEMFIKMTEDGTKDNIENQIKVFTKESIYDYDINVSKNDKIISLVTCTRFFGTNNIDFAVTGRLIRKNERMNNYSVKKNKNYKMLEEVWKNEKEEETST